MRYKLYGNTEFMDWLVTELKKKGQLWAWANIGWEKKKVIWRIK